MNKILLKSILFGATILTFFCIYLSLPTNKPKTLGRSEKVTENFEVQWENFNKRNIAVIHRLVTKEKAAEICKINRARFF